MGNKNNVSTGCFVVEVNVSEQILPHLLEAAVTLVARHKLFTLFFLISDTQQASKLTASEFCSAHMQRYIILRSGKKLNQHMFGSSSAYFPKLLLF